MPEFRAEYSRYRHNKREKEYQSREKSADLYTGEDYHSIPKGSTRNGIKNGLKIILDVENYDYAYFPRGAKGFRAVVGDSRDKGVINQNGFYISAGTY